MPIKLTEDQFGPLSEARLKDFEDEIGTRLPDDYRTFMLQSNGGCPVEDEVCFQTINACNQGFVDFGVLYSIFDPREYEGSDYELFGPLQVAYRSFQEDWCEFEDIIIDYARYLPIGQSWSGDVLLLVIQNGQKENFGNIMMLDHEHGDFIEVAPSFANFLNLLQYYPDE